MIFPYQRIAPKIKRPIIPVILKTTERFIIYQALIDSGADYCIFSIELAQILDIKLSKKKARLRSIGKEKITGFWGEVEISINSVGYKTRAIFAEISEFGHGILGQQGFFDHFDVRLSYKRQIVEIFKIEGID